ncbi:transcription factor complex helicase XPB subunit [Seminavis robusta]|uniref:DNA 3'-5' helicase n=1 Tax=Seminavis robusta TaxID=568900 RepID=A0A9N8DMI2_9STRA|nr:transcription factor complex helicase XPB subunit [Seminavis robusta]|eukprot:Sro162_g072900.1 transcription factor complex helicase XPB subunit (573) ;mRNA; f:66883-68601
MNAHEAIDIVGDSDEEMEDVEEKPMLASLVHEQGGHHIEIQNKDLNTVEWLLKDPVIRQAIKKGIQGWKPAPVAEWNVDGEPADGPEEALGVECFPIDPSQVDQVRQRAIELGHPLAEEYDFQSDHSIPNLPPIHLKPETKIRTYQSRALSQMLGSGRARSGMIVLPCGAGKTLTGVTAAHTIKKSVLCLTTNAVSVRQWKEQFQKWTTIKDSHIAVFTANSKRANLPESCILISTYQMIAHSGERAAESKAIMDRIQKQNWGLLLMDEAHVVPAPEYRRAIQSIKARCKLGLTATMVREDGKIADLRPLIGPTLYEAKWKDLTAQGYLANVKCLEVWCPMTPDFADAYKKEPKQRSKMRLCGVNPNKLRAVEMLVRYHESQGDKIIVFSDCIFTLEVFAVMLERPYLYGQTKEWEREFWLGEFRKDTREVPTILLSKIGDVAIDLPKANVLIQVTSHDASQRQEAQRLGRILRPKFGDNASFDAFFYTLVCTQTKEMGYCKDRRQYLVDQGYSFEVVEKLCDKANGLAVGEKYAYATPKDDYELLQEALKENIRRAQKEGGGRKRPARHDR